MADAALSIPQILPLASTASTFLTFRRPADTRHACDPHGRSRQRRRGHAASHQPIMGGQDPAANAAHGPVAWGSEGRLHQYHKCTEPVGEGGEWQSIFEEPCLRVVRAV